LRLTEVHSESINADFLRINNIGAGMVVKDLADHVMRKAGDHISQETTLEILINSHWLIVLRTCYHGRGSGNTSEEGREGGRREMHLGCKG
jgi:hypothetical protein